MLNKITWKRPREARPLSIRPAQEGTTMPSLMIRCSPELHALVKERAHQSRRSVNAYCCDVLGAPAARPDPLAQQLAQSLAFLVAIIDENELEGIIKLPEYQVVRAALIAAGRPVSS